MEVNAGSATRPTYAGASANPFRRPGLLARVAPFAVIAVLAEASLALPPLPDSAAAVASSVILLVAAAALTLAPWQRLPSWLPVIVPLTYAGSVLALILAARANSGVGLVLLIPLVWSVLFHSWRDSLVVAVAVIAVEALTSVAQHAGGAVIARRLLLWALLSAVIVLAAHRLRDELSAAYARSLELQAQIGQVTLARDRDRIAAELHAQVISKLFAAGLTMQGAAATGAQGSRAHIDQAIGELDEAIVLLRNAVFDISARPQSGGGLRHRVLEACQALDPVPEVSFTGTVDQALAAEDQDRLLALLREAFTLIGFGGAVELIALADHPPGLAMSCVAHLSEAPEGELSQLRDSAQRAGAGFRAERGADRIVVTWQLARAIGPTASAGPGQAPVWPGPDR